MIKPILTIVRGLPGSGKSTYAIEAEGKVVARIDNRLSDAEQEAYARLMVSAPKMLEALEAVKQYINGRQFYEMCPQTVDKVLDAIKVAKEKG